MTQLNLNDTLYQWSTNLVKKNPDANDILITMPLPGRNLTVDYTELHYNQMYRSHTITSSIDGFHFNHQLLAGRYMIFNDALLLMHEPGTGKTRTQLYAMLNALTAKLIKRILIINRSNDANAVAINTLKVLYEHEFKIYFELPVNKFIQLYIQTRTIRKLNDQAVEDYTGVIIDEAHVMNTEEEKSKTEKLEVLNRFVNNLSTKVGIKIILATATPIFGNVRIVNDYIKFFTRCTNPVENYGLTDFVSSIVSFTMINYDHIKTNQVTNRAITTSGDYDFDLDRGYGRYSLKMFITKPSPMQIADFIGSVLINTKRAEDNRCRSSFYANCKPIIVASHRSTPTGKIMQSPILDEIIRRGEETKYGIVVIYCDIKEKGADVVAEYFESRGIKRFNPGEQRVSANRKIPNPPGIQVYDTHIHNYRNAISAAYKSLPIISKKEIVNMRATIDQYRNASRAITSTHSLVINDLPFSEKVIKKMEDKYLILLDNVKKEEEIKTKIAELKKVLKQIEEARMMIIEKHQNEVIRDTTSSRYFRFGSSMKSNDRIIFERLNSPENWDGKMIKYVIGSKVMRDGTDIKHGVQIHILVPEWRIPGLVQAQHRIIRSNGHNEIIRQLALELITNSRLDPSARKYTLTEAQQEIRRRGINVEIYNHLLDVKDLTLDDMREAAMCFTQEQQNLVYQYITNGDYSDAALIEMRKLITSEQSIRGGEKLYECAIMRHQSVGAKQIEMRSQAIDYMLNVRKDIRERINAGFEKEVSEKEPVESNVVKAIGATEMFMTDHYIRRIIEEIKVLLLKKNVIDTDLIFEELLKNIEGCSTHIIAQAIKQLVERDRYVYNDNLGINMLINLYKTDSESILYLCTNDDPNPNSRNHPYNQYVDQLNISLIENFQRTVTTIDDSDIALPKVAKTFYKMCDLIERATVPGYQLTELELEFMFQMGNYWMVLESDIKNKSLPMTEIKFYVIEKHIERPSIDILSENLLVHEFDPNPHARTWKVKHTLSIRDEKFVRLARLAQNYSNYVDPNNRSDYPTAANGLILTKGMYTSLRGVKVGEKLIDRLLGMEGAIIRPYENKIIVRDADDSNSHGSQLGQGVGRSSLSLNEVTTMLSQKASSKRYLMFFLYMSRTEFLEKKRNDFLTLRTIKEYEQEIINLAKAGTPPPMFQIQVIQDIPSEKERIATYRSIYQDYD